MGWRKWGVGIVAIGAIIGGKEISKKYEWEKDALMEVFKNLSDQLGIWAIPAYVGVHTITLALCLPSAVFFEAGAALLFGFLPAVLCVFSAKILAASLSFWIGRLIFMYSSSATQWVQGNKHFHVLLKGVEQDGWKFVLLARFSPVPSYVINYALAATKVRFFVDFLLPTMIGCLPMIIQNTSIGSLAGAAVASASGSHKSQIWSYIFPLIGIVSSILISFRIRTYSKNISVESSKVENFKNPKNTTDSSQLLNSDKDKNVKKRR
ncbi:uncharacterized protein LOC104895290 [Beta vulgaris subsp. vulgaris]|uniref:uncharacterized protein LOC104895290 n=1 Tax=Beta vulgaris subsp. vulgaris TaxID=3555 RepID=UPI002036935D|nr:uncharacterized protein LOC104895290 [Beta vulgaris subsp. vulgaris]